MAKEFEVTGLKKKQYRGSSVETVIKKTVKAENEKKAAEKFEKENGYYAAVGVVELNKIDKQIRSQDEKQEKLEKEEEDAGKS